jgi:4-amino-4-deoxy-L-arabinose transferase-like glycosyltransferase
MAITDILQPAEGATDRAAAEHRSAVFWLVLVALALFLPGFTGLQPMDRDEPRFAQASKQMLETHDFVSIRFQDEARNKKPVGIYWLQAGAVAAAEALGFPDARRTIWLYRLPALAGALAGVLLTYWAALSFCSRRFAFLAALLFGSTILIGVEARLAKTDAVITATVVAAMGILARAYLPGRSSGENNLQRVPKSRQPFLFWAAIGVGILVKGPITPMVPALAAVALGVKDRAWNWLSRLRPLAGFALTLAMVMPWFVLIMIETHGAFLKDSVGGDMLGKVAGGQELHGAPPGTYLVAFLGTGWPMAPFAILAAPFAWKTRREPAIAFLLAWIVPSWLVFEAIPTKLPHYVLPLYPAIAILTAVAMERGGLALDRRWGQWSMRLVPGLALVLPAAGAAGALIFGTSPGWLYFVCLPILLWQIWRWNSAFRRWQARETGPRPVVAGTALLAFLVYVLTFGGLLTTSFFTPFAVSPRLAAARQQALAATPGCRSLSAASAGYHEPSLVFLTETDILLTDGKGAGDFLRAEPCRIAFVDANQESVFKEALGDVGGVRLAQRLEGINLNGGKRLDIGVYVRQKASP